MNIYLVTSLEHPTPEKYYNFFCYTYTKEKAANMFPSPSITSWKTAHTKWVSNPKHVQVIYLGKAKDTITKPKLFLAQYPEYHLIKEPENLK